MGYVCVPSLKASHRPKPIANIRRSWLAVLFAVVFIGYQFARIHFLPVHLSYRGFNARRLHPIVTPRLESVIRMKLQKLPRL